MSPAWEGKERKIASSWSRQWNWELTREPDLQSEHLAWREKKVSYIYIEALVFFHKRGCFLEINTKQIHFRVLRLP